MRILLFLATNFAIMILLFAVSALAEGYLASQGIQFERMGLMVFALVFGMGGSLISLAISKWMALRATGAKVIEEPRTDVEQWLVQTVGHQAQAAGIGMPAVAVFPSDSPNAFATGARRDKALVAVSTGLLANMSRDEVEAVLGHEISHVANGDMITLTLVQGVLNVFVLFFSRIIGEAIDRIVFRNEEGRGIGYFVGTIFAQIVLTLLASIIVMWFSRRREFRADAGGARLAGKDSMVGALKRLAAVAEGAEPLPDSMQAFGISSGGARNFMRLFSSHPPLEERIAALESRSHA
jgi:heat shock protein HtpX